MSIPPALNFPDFPIFNTYKDVLDMDDDALDLYGDHFGRVENAFRAILISGTDIEGKELTEEDEFVYDCLASRIHTIFEESIAPWVDRMREINANPEQVDSDSILNDGDLELANRFTLATGESFEYQLGLILLLALELMKMNDSMAA